jgi:sugar phosphate isomerase/epimerase
MPRIPLAVQLYTVRDQTQKDFAGTVRKLAAIGYRAVELAGYGNLSSAAEVKKALDDAGMAIHGCHVGIDQLESNLEKALDDQQTLGNRLIVCPWVPEERRKDADGWKGIADSLNKAGQRIQASGLTLAYHNHSFEFKQFDGKTGLEILFEHTPAELVKSELDVFWVKHGGLDPVDIINRLGARVAVLHLKDMDKQDKNRFAPVGNGILDFPSIIDAGQKHGVCSFIVEQDNTYETPSLEAVKISLENLKKLGVV